MDALELLTRLHEHGCPTYGYDQRYCEYCDADLIKKQPHKATCLWVEVEHTVYKAGTADYHVGFKGDTDGTLDWNEKAQQEARFKK